MNSAYVPYPDRAKHSHLGGAWALGADIYEGEMRTHQGGLFICKPGMGHIATALNEPIPDGSTLGLMTSEVPTGTKDGVNKTFTLTYAPMASPMVFFGSGGGSAAMLYGTDFTYTGTTLTLITFAPHTADGDVFFVYYLR